jgi:hypothetical protein
MSPPTSDSPLYCSLSPETIEYYLVHSIFQTLAYIHTYIHRDRKREKERVTGRMTAGRMVVTVEMGLVGEGEQWGLKKDGDKAKAITISSYSLLWSLLT